MSQPALPEGYRAAPVTEAMEQGVVDVINAANRWETRTEGDFTNLEEMRSGWQEEGFNPDTDRLMVLAPDGNVVGYGEFFGFNALNVRYGAFNKVHPANMGLGIGGYLLGWVIERACKNLPKAPEGARVVMHQFIESANLPACDLLERSGWQNIRQSYRMRILFEASPALPQVPEGIEIRPMRPGEERVLLAANHESFQDHWGAVDEPFEEYYKRWMYYVESDPSVNPVFWYLALDGETVAGVLICNPTTHEDPEMGWIWQLSVREPYRKRGLGLALLQQGFHALYQNGSKRAALGVDANSLTGANRLYERAGMHVWKKTNIYEYELRPGSDLMKK